MVRLKPFFAPESGVTIGRLLQQTHLIHGAVAKSLVGQGHQHMLENIRSLEQTLLHPVSRMSESTAQEKGHQLQAWIHVSRIEDTLETFDQESRRLIASQLDTRANLQQITQRLEQLTTRVESRKELLDRRTDWAAATLPTSSKLDPINVLALPTASLNPKLAKQDLEQAVKHVNALDKEIALLDGQIKQQPQPISREEEDIFIAQRNALTEYRNAWATGRLKGTSQFKSAIGLTPERKRLEQNLERSKQLAPLELALYRMERAVEAVHSIGQGEKFPAGAVNAARESVIHLRDAWRAGHLDGSSPKGMNPLLVLTSPNEQRLNLELAVIKNAFIQLQTIPRTEQVDSAQERLDFHTLTHRPSAKPHIRRAAIIREQTRNKQRASVADLNTDLRNIYTDLRNKLGLPIPPPEPLG